MYVRGSSLFMEGETEELRGDRSEELSGGGGERNQIKSNQIKFYLKSACDKIILPIVTKNNVILP